MLRPQDWTRHKTCDSFGLEKPCGVFEACWAGTGGLPASSHWTTLEWASNRAWRTWRRSTRIRRRMTVTKSNPSKHFQMRSWVRQIRWDWMREWCKESAKQVWDPFHVSSLYIIVTRESCRTKTWTLIHQLPGWRWADSLFLLPWLGCGAYLKSTEGASSICCDWRGTSSPHRIFAGCELHWNLSSKFHIL